MPSPQVLTDVQLLMGAYDLSPFSGAFDHSAEATFLPARNFAGLGYEIILPAGIKATSSITGNADLQTGGVSVVFNTSQAGSQHAYTINPAGSTAAAGQQVTMVRGRLAKGKPHGGNVGAVSDFSLNLESDDAPVEGFLGAPHVSYTTSGLTGTAVALTGPTAAQRLYAALHVTAAAGTNLVVKVQSDNGAGFATPTDRITFSTMSAIGWQWLSVAGDLSTETHWRVVATVASGTFTFACSFGVS